MARKTAVLQEFNDRREVAEAEARRITEEVMAGREAELDAAMDMYDDLYGPNATHRDAKLTMKEKLEKYPDAPLFGSMP